MKRYFLKLLLSLLIFPLFISAQTDPLFLSQDVLKLDIYADMEAVLADVGEAREWHNALFIYTESGKQYKLDAELKSRGNFRRKKEICGFPPLKVNFRKKQIAGSIFEGCDKIKLVTHCNSDDKEANENVLTEYLIYRIYNLISDTSLRVRLCEITWHDIIENQQTITRFGFFIEKIENLASRHNLNEIEAESISPGQMDMSSYHRFALLQFLVGNTDWSVLIPQNIKLLAQSDSSGFVPVPYDFDLCAWIAPSYAGEEYGFDYENTRPEIKGYCETLDDYNASIEAYLNKEQGIIALVENFPLLSKKERVKLVRFLRNRFDILEDRDKLEKVFINYCK